MRLFLLFLAAIASASAWLVGQDLGLITVTVMERTFEGPLARVLAGAVVAGALTGLVLLAPFLLRARRETRGLRREVSTLEQRLAVVLRLTDDPDAA